MIRSGRAWRARLPARASPRPRAPPPRPAAPPPAAGSAPQLPGSVQFVRAARVAPDPGGLLIEVESSWGAVRLPVPLMGEFNVDNALTVLAVLLAWNIPLQDAARARSVRRAASGRRELFGGRGRAPLA